MEVGAVTLLGIAGVENVAMSPARSRLVIAHGGEDVVVDGASLIEGLSLALSDLHG